MKWLFGNWTPAGSRAGPVIDAEKTMAWCIRRHVRDESMGVVPLPNEGTMVSTNDESVRQALQPREGTGSDRDARRLQFETEAMAHREALYSFALKLARSRDDAEDLVSDTMLRALERWEQYHLGTNIRAWLFTILYHVFVSRKRRIDAREVQLPEDTEGWAMYEAVGEADPEGRFFDSFLDDEVTRALGALPDEYRTAVVLSDLQGLRYSEIADVLGVPEGTVKSRLFRGRRQLQRRLADFAVEMGYIKASVVRAALAPPLVAASAG